MNNITKIKPFANSGTLVDYIISSIDKDKYSSVAFIGYKEIISEILGTLIGGYKVDIECLHMDECAYNDLYRLAIDEDFIISVVPIHKDNGEYIMTDADIQFISDEVSTKYVFALDKRGQKYQIFTLDSDFEEECEDFEDDNVWTSGYLQMVEDNKMPSKYEIEVEVSFNGKPYEELSDDEKQLFDLMMDWRLL